MCSAGPDGGPTFQVAVAPVVASDRGTVELGALDDGEVGRLEDVGELACCDALQAANSRTRATADALRLITLSDAEPALDVRDEGIAMPGQPLP